MSSPKLSSEGLQTKFDRKGSEIVGAIFVDGDDNTQNVSSRLVVDSGSYVSEEFKIFWGDKFDKSWFARPAKFSPGLILIVFLYILNLYLCGRLLFSNGELQDIITGAEFDSELAQAELTKEFEFPEQPAKI